MRRRRRRRRPDKSSCFKLHHTVCPSATAYRRTPRSGTLPPRFTQPQRGFKGEGTARDALLGARAGGRARALSSSCGNNDLNAGGCDDGGGGGGEGAGGRETRLLLLPPAILSEVFTAAAAAAADNCGVRRVDRRCSGPSADRGGEGSERRGGEGRGRGRGGREWRRRIVSSGARFYRACAISWGNGALDAGRPRDGHRP